MYSLYGFGMALATYSIYSIIILSSSHCGMHSGIVQISLNDSNEENSLHRVFIHSRLAQSTPSQDSGFFVIATCKPARAYRDYRLFSITGPNPECTLGLE